MPYGLRAQLRLPRSVRCASRLRRHVAAERRDCSVRTAPHRIDVLLGEASRTQGAVLRARAAPALHPARRAILGRASRCAFAVKRRKRDSNCVRYAHVHQLPATRAVGQRVRILCGAPFDGTEFARVRFAAWCRSNRPRAASTANDGRLRRLAQLRRRFGRRMANVVAAYPVAPHQRAIGTHVGLTSGKARRATRRGPLAMR